MKKPPLFVFCLDAGDPHWLESWAATGHLPAAASLLERGCHGTTGGVELISEHGVWFSLLSGVPRGRHGCYYFRQLQAGTYQLRPFTGHDVKAPPFWSHLPQEARAAIVDVPDIPLVPHLKGVQLTNWAVHRGWVSQDPVFAPASLPASYAKELEEATGERWEILENSASSIEEDRALLKSLLGRVQRKGAVCRHALRKMMADSSGVEPFDLAVFAFGEAHTAGHQFWKYREEAPHTARWEAGVDMRHAIREVYAAIDQELQSLLDMLPEECHICLLTSLGYEPHYPYAEVTRTACYQLGYQAHPAPSSAPVSWKPLDLARRVLPESWRVAASRHLSRDTREKLMAEQFVRSTDWSRTRAFSIPSFYTGFIRVNLKGREPNGTVEPSDYAKLLDELTYDFEHLRDARTGENIVRRVWRCGEVFGSEPPRDGQCALPDLLVDYYPTTAPRERIMHPRVQSEWTVAPGEWVRDSDHSKHGLWALCGPEVKELGAQGEIELLDIAPTLMHLLGCEATPDMAGKILNQLLESRVLAACP